MLRVNIPLSGQRSVRFAKIRIKRDIHTPRTNKTEISPIRRFLRNPAARPRTGKGIPESSGTFADLPAPPAPYRFSGFPSYQFI